MMTTVLAAAVLSVLAHQISLDPSAGCQCALTQSTSGWCAACSIGFIAGVRVPSFVLFEALDDEGHEIEPTFLECEACRTAAAANGICSEHGWGIADGRIYGSLLTYYLACGDFADPRPGALAGFRAQSRTSAQFGMSEQLEPTARTGQSAEAESVPQSAHSGETGWCERCRIGWIGPVMFHDAAAHRAAVVEYRRFRLAVDTLDRCELSAVARYYGGYCPECRITYRDGEPVDSEVSVKEENNDE